MVIRIVILFMITTATYASCFSKAFNYHKNREFSKSNSYLNRCYKQSKYKGRKHLYPNNSLSLMAKNYHLLGDYKRSIKTYFLVLNKKYKREDREVRQVFRSSPDDIDEIDDLSRGQLSIYYGLFGVYTTIYKKHEYPQYKKLMGLYGELLIEQDYKADRVEKVKASLVAKEKLKKDSIYKSKFYIGLGYSSWQDSIGLTAPDGTEEELKSSAAGTSFLLGYANGNNFYETRYEFSATFAKASVGEDSSSFTYFQSNVSEVMLWFSYAKYFKPSAQTAIGIGIPIVYRTGDFTQPSTFTIDNTDFLTTGLYTSASWEMSDFIFDIKVGKLLGFESLFSQLSLSYGF